MGELNLEIKIKEPFDFELSVRKPAGWHWATLFEIYEDKTLYTTLRLANNKLVGLKLHSKNSLVKIKAFSKQALDNTEKNELVELLQIGLGAQDDLRKFYSLASKDTLVKKLKQDLFGMHVGFPTGVFERALLAISLQMAPTNRSNQMMECLIKQYGESIRLDNKEILYWPSPETIVNKTPSQLAQECNLGYRAKFIRKLAEEIVAGFPTVLQLSKMGEEEASTVLKHLPGIGPYSAQIISPHFGFPLDIWSSRIFHEVLFKKTPPQPRKVIELVNKKAEAKWGKYKRYVFIYVLNDLPNLTKMYPITKPT